MGWLVGLVALSAQPAEAAAHEDAFLAGLRSRRLYELAEKYCTDLLAREDLDASRRTDLTIELSRTLAEHALDAPDAAALWRQATDVVDRFAATHPRSPRLKLVRLQGALALAAQGQAARQQAAVATDERAAAAARDVLRRAVAEFGKLNREVDAELRQRGRAAPAPGQLTTAELQSLQLNLHYELGRALLDQALCYPEGSPDRINSLTQASDELAAVTRQDCRLRWSASAALEEIACWRLMGEFPAAGRKLAQLAKATLGEDLAQRLRAERINLALARGRIDEALSEAGASGQQPTGPEAAFARLEALLAAWRRAGQQGRAAESAEWQRSAVEQAELVGRLYGPHWMRRSETVLARALADSTDVQTAETLAYAAASYYRGGQFDKALSTYDEAVRRARDDGQSEQARQLALTAATIEKERGHYGEALQRFRKLALAEPGATQAAEAHLLGVYCAAQLAQAEQPPKLDEYERLLREHVETWPDGPTAGQAWCWLGRLAEHRRDWQRAIELLARVEPGDPRYGEAVEAMGRCYESGLDELHENGQTTQPSVDDALGRLEQIAAAADRPGARPNAATRAATLAAARIWLKEIPTGSLPAERLLRGILDHDPLAPEECQATARMLLIPALAAQGKGAQADALVDELPTGDTAARLAVLQILAAIRRRAPGDTAGKYAAAELSIQNGLLARADELDGDTLRAVRREHAMTLAESGHRREGLAELATLAHDFPRDGQTHEDLATLLAEGNDAEQRTALAKWGDVARHSRPATARWFRAHYALARVQFKLGQTSAARQTIEHVAKRYPDFDGGALKPKFEQLLSEVDGRR